MLVEYGWSGEKGIASNIVVHNIFREIWAIVFIEIELIEDALLGWGVIFFFEHGNRNRIILIRCGDHIEYICRIDTEVGKIINN